MEVNGKLARIVVRESKEPAESAYRVRTDIRAELKPEFVAEAAQRARRNNESIVFVHTHPFAMNQFSQIDDAGEEKLRDFLEQRIPNAAHAAMLITPEVTIARELGKQKELEVVGIGPEIIWGNSHKSANESYRYDRQIRAFGAAGQKILKSLKVEL